MRTTAAGAVLKGAALVNLVLVLPGLGEIRYSGYREIAIGDNFTGVYLDIQTGATGYSDETPLSGWDINPFFAGYAVANSPGFQPVRVADGPMEAIFKLGEGALIDAADTYDTSNGGAGYGGSLDHLGAGGFASGQEGYLGFRLNGTGYGWMRVVFTGSGSGAVIRDWAYDTEGTVSGSIVAGRVRQEAPVAGEQLFTLSPQGSESFTLGTAIADNGSDVNRVEKTGTGTAVLGVTNTYTGTTTVAEGRLLVNGSIGSSGDGGGGGVVVSSGATLGGTGDIYRAVTAHAGSVVSPGASVGELGLSGLDLSGSLLVEWDGVADFDLLTVGGLLTLGGGSLLDFSGDEGVLSLSSAYVFASYGSLSGTFGTVSNLPAGFSIDYNYLGGNQIALVPESSTGVLVTLATLGIVLRRRRAA